MSFNRSIRFSSDPKKEKSSFNSSAPKKEKLSLSSAPKKEKSSSNSSALIKEKSSPNSSAPIKGKSSSNSSAPKIKVSTSTSSIQKSFKYDVFLSFRGEDTRKNFVDHLYEALKDKGIYTYKDDVKIQKGKRISDDLFKSIEDSKFYIIVFTKNYASSSWCLKELVKIMECHKMPGHTAYPVFYDVEPTEVRNQSGAVRKAFFKNKKKETAEKWREALKEAADLAGWELKNTLDGHEAKFIQKIVHEISLELRSITFDFDEKLVGMETRVKDVVSSLEVGIEEVRMIGIKGMGGAGKTTTARAVFDNLSANFEAKSFVGNVREVSKASMFGLKNLQEQVLSNVLNEHVTLNSVDDGKNMMKKRVCGKKVLLVLDDVDHIGQLKALAGEPKWFKPGSRILITTRDEQVLIAHRVNVIRDIVLLSEQEAISLFSRYAFGKENPVQGYEELSGKVVRYGAGLPLTVEVMGSFLCGKDKLEWVDAIDRLEKIPLKDTLEKLELSYISLEDEYKEIFLDIACILKGEKKEEAITILECCGFHARIGLKVLEQRSLITVDEINRLGMHDHIEEMGKNIVRREHPDEHNKHSRLWIREEIEDILAYDKGTKATRCLKFYMSSRGNVRNLMKDLGKMKKLRYLELYLVRDFNSERDDARLGSHMSFVDTNHCFTNSLKYLKCTNYPFLYLPKTFQPNNLVGLEMESSRRMIQLWEEGEKKVLKKLKYLSLCRSKLTTFEFRITLNLELLSLKYSYKLKELCMPDTCHKLKHLDVSDSELISFDLGFTPNLETLSLESSCKFEKLCMPVSCRKLKYLNISLSKLRTFDLGLTPNLETLSLEECAQFEELHVSAACPNLKFLNLSRSRLRSLDLELIPNLERLDLVNCKKLVEINAPVGCMKKVDLLNLDGSLMGFTDFSFYCKEPKFNCYSATFHQVKVHPNSYLPNLKFHCYYNEYLPSSVGNIEKLISFGLCACTDFKKFSDMICSLRCLNKLELECSIPEFPKDLGQLECLEELCLSLTQITHLPDSICVLKRLKVLVSNCNLLEMLPEDLGQLECLEKLYVSSTKIEYLPDSICMLKHLKSLTVDDGDLLEKLPEDLGKLECLEKLHVSSEKIECLPDSICTLKRLKSLELRNGLLEKLPEDFGKLECLEKLCVRSEKIEYLPDGICMLKRLKSLDVRDCCRLGKLPEDIGQFESLERLDLRATNIKHLPDSICMLKRLKWLDMSNCYCLGKLPEDIGQLECLEELCLSFTKIKHLPDGICMLKHLKYLELDECALLEKLPEDLGRLECLEHLYTAHTGISHLPQSMFGLKGLLIEASPELLQKYENHFSSVTKSRSWWTVKVSANNG